MIRPKKPYTAIANTTRHALTLIILMLTLPLQARLEKMHWQKDWLLGENNELVGIVTAKAPEGFKVKNTKKDAGENTWYVEWTFTAQRDVDDVRLCIDFDHQTKPDWWMIPAVSYNGNQWGRGQEPKGASYQGHWYTYSYRRTPMPGAVYSEGDSYAVATWGEVPQKEDDDFSCSAMPMKSIMTHRLIWPEEEQPITYSTRDQYKLGWRRKHSMKKGETRTLGMYVLASRKEPCHRSIRHMLDFGWLMTDTPTYPTFTDKDVWDISVRFVKECLWAEEGVFQGFSIGLEPTQEGQWRQRPTNKYEAGWCGQNISLANSLLCDFLKHGERTSLEKGLATLDCWTKYCPLANGLFVAQFDDVLQHKESTIDACNLGTTALQLFEAHKLALQLRLQRPTYRDIALRICDFMLQAQQPDGCMGRGWTYSGQCVEREGTVGAFCIPALLRAFEESGDKRYFDAALRAYIYYISDYQQNGYTTAGALDTWCIDKESAVPLLKSAIKLHKLTGHQQFVQDAIDISYYISTWMWHYDAVLPATDIFTQQRFHTFGATSVSVQHHHLDFYACQCIPEWRELSRITDDTQWDEKANAVWRNCCHFVSNGTRTIGGIVRPAGAVNEAFFESSWSWPPHTEPIPATAQQGRINQWLVAWPCAFRLEVMRMP